MNYYEHHLGDYAEATAHLSILEDGVYSRLIRKYYATELPIPADVKAVQRLVGARSPAERDAVKAVLQEFFVLQEDGWHNERCDQELERYHESQPVRDARRENAKERQKRARERRSSLFDALRSHGVVPPWDTPVTQLETLLSRVTGPSQAEPVTRDNTASQSPLPSHQTPDTSKRQSEAKGSVAKAPPPTPPPDLDLEVWERWVEYRRGIKKPIKPPSLEAAMTELAKFGSAQAAVVQQSIAHGWQGLFELKTANGTGKPAAEHTTKFSRAMEALDRA